MVFEGEDQGCSYRVDITNVYSDNSRWMMNDNSEERKDYDLSVGIV